MKFMYETYGTFEEYVQRTTWECADINYINSPSMGPFYLDQDYRWILEESFSDL